MVGRVITNFRRVRAKTGQTPRHGAYLDYKRSYDVAGEGAAGCLDSLMVEFVLFGYLQSLLSSFTDITGNWAMEQ